MQAIQNHALQIITEIEDFAPQNGEQKLSNDI